MEVSILTLVIYFFSHGNTIALFSLHSLMPICKHRQIFRSNLRTFFCVQLQAKRSDNLNRVSKANVDIFNYIFQLFRIPIFFFICATAVHLHNNNRAQRGHDDLQPRSEKVKSVRDFISLALSCR